MWHFDPWWVLNDDRFRIHEAVPALRRTNICGYDTTLQGVWFALDLATAKYVVVGSGDSQAIRRFRPGVLTASVRARAQPPARPPEEAPVAWRLRPFWQ